MYVVELTILNFPQFIVKNKYVIKLDRKNENHNKANDNDYKLF